jgi:predicted ABC-type ATPase
MLEQIHSLAHRRLDFGFETTLSGKAYIKLLQKMKKGVEENLGSDLRN